MNTDSLGVLATLKVQVSVAGLGRLSGTTLSFPITVGVADATSLKGEILHAGGLTMQAGNTTLQLISFTADTTGAKPQLSALAVANNAVLGQVNVFDLSLPAGLVAPIVPGWQCADRSSRSRCHYFAGWGQRPQSGF